jgi:1-acyl-sn-glycerol-3-phosphate acyltransferase
VIRSLWTALHLFLATICIAPLVLSAPLVRARDSFYDWATRNWSRWILWAAGTEVIVERAGSVDLTQPFVVISNHESWFDVFAVSTVIPKRFRFVAKKELAKIPLFGQAWQAAGHISIDRTDTASAVQTLQRTGAMLRSDASAVIIFPEGTRSPTGELLPFKKGAFKLALLSGVDLLPIGVIGGRAVMPKGGWRVRRGRIIVRFGDPIRVAEYAQNEMDRLMKDARRRIEQLRSDGAPAGREP